MPSESEDPGTSVAKLPVYELSTGGSLVVYKQFAGKGSREFQESHDWICFHRPPKHILKVIISPAPVQSKLLRAIVLLCLHFGAPRVS
jgi:hypothetical protein